VTNRANDAWEALLSAHASLMRRFSAEDVWEDISMKEYDVLYTLSKCPEPIRPTDLNQHVLLSQPALSRLVDRLAAREPQVTRILTGNADGNQHMIAINEQLGFRVLSRWPSWELDVAGVPPDLPGHG